MKKHLTTWLLCLSLSSLTLPLYAASTASILSLHNPAHFSGIQIGDVLQRSVTIETGSTDQLVRNSLPIKGLNRDGIELKDITVERDNRSGKALTHITFSYQVFAHSSKPVQLQLPAEHITFSNGQSETAVELPSWRFWLSALLPDKLLKAKSSVIPQYKPSLLDHAVYDRWLLVSLCSALLGCMGLLYVNAAGARWLPWMNGAFARASRQIKKLPDTPAGQKQAALLLLQAFNSSLGSNLMANNVPDFLAQKPRFQPLAGEINAFFSQANTLLYGNQASVPNSFMREVNILSRRLRDCERGAK